MPGRQYINVILPLRLEWEPCYCLPEGEKVHIGQRVEVVFSGKQYVAVVSAIDVTPDIDSSRIREVIRTETFLEDVLEEEIVFWRWIAGYYMCTAGEVYKAAYPSLKLQREESRARAVRNKITLREKTITLYESRIGKIDARISSKEAELQRHTRPESKIVQKLRTDIEKLNRERQALLERIDMLKASGTVGGGITTSDGCPQPVGGGITASDGCPRPGGGGATTAGPESSSAARSKPALILGTQRYDRYVEAASRVLALGRSVLILVPEIKRADALMKQLQGRFPVELMVFHSALSSGTRLQAADILRSGVPCVVLGTHSSLLLPFRDLGLVIVDEEQDPSYKRSEPAPRYNGRDSAIALASLRGAEVLLGSVCPSLETVLNCISGKFRTLYDGAEADPQFWQQPCRWIYGDGFELIDVVAERRKFGMAGPLSFKLLDALRQTAARSQRSLIVSPSYALGDIGAVLADRLGEEAGRSVTVADLRTSKWYEDGDLGLVAVLLADNLLSRSDFRADERAFQMLQIFRSKCPGGRFIIQTARMDHPVFSASGNILNHLLRERQDFSFPPFTRIVDFVCKDDRESRKALMIRKLADTFSAMPEHGTRFLGLQALSDRVRVILPKNPDLASAKTALGKALSDFEADYKYSQKFSVDVDPE